MQKINKTIAKVSAKLLLTLGILCTAGFCWAKPIHIVAYGDSNTNGKAVQRSEAYPAQLEVLLKSKGFEVEVTNAGTDGITSNWLFEAVNRKVPDDTDIVILQGFPNDKITKKGKGAVDTVIFVNKLIENLTGRGILVILSTYENIQAEVPNNEILRVPEINQMAPDHKAGDGHHLTPEGYRIVAETLLPTVIKAIHMRTGAPDS